MSEINYKMPSFDDRHTAISSRITTLQYLLAHQKGHTSDWLIQETDIDKNEFKRMEFCYDPKHQESLKQMVSWLKKQEPIIKNYNKNISDDAYNQDYPPLSIFDDLFN